MTTPTIRSLLLLNEQVKIVKPEENFHPGVMAITPRPGLPGNREKTSFEKNTFHQNPEKEPGLKLVLPDRQ